MARRLLALPVLLRLLLEPVRDGLVAHRLGHPLGDLTILVDTAVIDPVDPSLVQQNDEDRVVSETSQA